MTTRNDNHGFSEAELAGLGPEERAALGIGAGADDDDEADGLRAIASGDDSAAGAGDADEADDADDADGGADGDGAADDEGGADRADDGAGDDDPAAGAEGAAAGADADGAGSGDGADGAASGAGKGEGAAGTAAADEGTPFVPQYTAAMPENYAARIAELDGEFTTATEEFRANNITLDEMLERHAKIDRERRDLDNQKLKAEISTEYRQQTAAQLWQRDISMFMARAKREDGIDYAIYDGCPAKNHALSAAWDAEVKRLANDPKNADKDNQWFLETAHSNVREAFNVQPGGVKDAQGDKGKKNAAQQRRPKLNDVPRTLAHTPPAGTGGVTGKEGEFDHLDGLDGLALENAVAAMTPAQQERYARA